MIQENPAKCSDLPKLFVVALFQKHDTNTDGKLDYDEFTKLCQEQRWLLRVMCVKYCNLVIPRKVVKSGKLLILKN